MKKHWVVGLSVLCLVARGAEADKNAEWEARTGFVIAERKADIVVQPKDIPGLRLWLDAGKGITADGAGRVSAWGILVVTDGTRCRCMSRPCRF